MACEAASTRTSQKTVYGNAAGSRFHRACTRPDLGRRQPKCPLGVRCSLAGYRLADAAALRGHCTPGIKHLAQTLAAGLIGLAAQSRGCDALSAVTCVSLRS